MRGTRFAVSAVLLLMTPACKDEPTFDERYSAAQEKVSKTATGIDSALEAESGNAAVPQTQPTRVSD